MLITWRFFDSKLHMFAQSQKLQAVFLAKTVDVVMAYITPAHTHSLTHTV
jgi:hypothetical protein